MSDNKRLMLLTTLVVSNEIKHYKDLLWTTLNKSRNIIKLLPYAWSCNRCLLKCEFFKTQDKIEKDTHSQAFIIIAY